MPYKEACLGCVRWVTWGQCSGTFWGAPNKALPLSGCKAAEFYKYHTCKAASFQGYTDLSRRRWEQFKSQCHKPCLMGLSSFSWINTSQFVGSLWLISGVLKELILAIFVNVFIAFMEGWIYHHQVLKAYSELKKKERKENTTMNISDKFLSLYLPWAHKTTCDYKLKALSKLKSFKFFI